MTKARACWRAGRVREVRSTLTSMSGGSVERAMKAWLVRPRGCPSASIAVRMVTPVGKAPAIAR